jgi:hypothetical protein
VHVTPNDRRDNGWVPIGSDPAGTVVWATQGSLDDDWVYELIARYRAGEQPEAIQVHRAADGTYEVVDGHHRLAAAAQAGLASIPAELVSQVHHYRRSWGPVPIDLDLLEV